MTAEPAFDIDRTLEALADPYRRRTVDLLRQGPRRAGELAEVLGLAAPAMSRHLRVLRLSGIVRETHPEFDARVRIYELRAAPMAGLKAWLEEAEQGWVEELAAFKQHIEAQNGGATRLGSRPPKAP